MTVQEPTQVTSHTSLSVVFQQMKYKDVLFTSGTNVHCQTLPGVHSYLTYLLNFPDFPVPNKSIISYLVNHFCDRGALHWVTSNKNKRGNACIAEHGGHFQHLM